MESGRMINENPYKSSLEVEKGLETSLVDEGRLPKCCVPVR
jgi:hypothetical protein